MKKHKLSQDYGNFLIKWSTKKGEFLILKSTSLQKDQKYFICELFYLVNLRNDNVVVFVLFSIKIL